MDYDVRFVVMFCELGPWQFLFANKIINNAHPAKLFNKRRAVLKTLLFMHIYCYIYTFSMSFQCHISFPIGYR